MASLIRRLVPNHSLSVGVNLGILTIGTTFNMTTDEVIDSAKVAKSGPSVLNVKGDADVLQYVVKGLVNARVLARCGAVIEEVNNLQWHASMVRRGGKLLSAPFDVAGLSKDVKIMLSVALSIGTVAGIEVAVIVVRRLIRKLEAGVQRTAVDVDVDDAHLDFAIHNLFNDLKAGGQVAALEAFCALYDEQSGLKWGWQYGHRYRSNITEALVCLVEWAFDCTVGDVAAERWATHSSKVHKACFLLQRMGWKVRAVTMSSEGKPTDLVSDDAVRTSSAAWRPLFLETGTPLRMTFLETVTKEGDAPPQLRGNGGGVKVRLENLSPLVGATLSDPARGPVDMGKVENAWALGLEKGKRCRIVRETSNHRCTYAFHRHPAHNGASSAQYPASRSAARLLVSVGFKAAEYADEFHYICGATMAEYEELPPGDVGGWSMENPTARIILAYLIGFIYGEIHALAIDIQLAPFFQHVFVSWTDSPREFVDVMGALLIPAEREDGLGFTAVCQVIAAAYCGDSTSILKGGEKADCVGVWTRRGLLLMVGVLDPTADFRHCSNAMLLPDWPVNLHGYDNYVISANRFFGRESGGCFLPATYFSPTVEVAPPSTRMSIGCSPNLSTSDQGTNMHCMFADGHLMFSGSIMATIASLYEAVVPCSCGGHPGRTKRCRHSKLFTVTDQDLMEERLYVSETYKSEAERMRNGAQSPEPIQADSKGVVLVHGDPKWAYAAASMYIDAGIKLAGSCLSCAVDATEHIVIQYGLGVNQPEDADVEGRESPPGQLILAPVQ